MSKLKKWVIGWWARRFIDVRDEPIDFYIERLASGVCFSFSRFGDGEWSAILRKKGANCDGHEYFPQLGERLTCALLKPYPYLYGIQRNALRTMGFAIAAFVRKYNVKLKWYNSDVFHYANIDGKLFPFIRLLRDNPTVVVGPQHLRQLNEGVFPYVHFIEIPSKNCFLQIESIKEKILCWAQGKTKVIYTFSASMAANVLIHDLYPIIGNDNWLLDLGSIWDIYVGVKSRSCFADRDWRLIISRNLGEISSGSLKNFLV